MKNRMKNYYSATLILAAMVSAVLIFGGVRPEINGDRTNAAQNLQNEKAVEHLKQNGDFDSLSEAFQAARYKIEQNGETLGANNQANQMQAQFDESGNLRLSGTAQNWQTVFRLKSFGRGAQQSAVGGGTWQAKENRVENRRVEFGLTEYFENRPDGLEQGFILDEKPSGAENLHLILQTNGELLATASADGQTINLSDKSGVSVLRYEKLKVWDAENKDLTARMTTGEAGEIRLEVEDANAVYPLTIDPTFVQSQKLTANDGESSDSFGGSVAISGDTVVVGAQLADGANAGQGAAYVFVRSGGVWTQQAKLTANDGATGDNFGNSVAISGDTVVVGATTQDINSNFGQGAAYIFIRTGNIWLAQEKLIANDGAAGDNFGNSVAISNDTAIIGAYSDTVGSNEEQGSAYVFVRNGGAWTQQARLTANDGRANDFFGDSVAISSSTVIIGASEADINFNVDFGAAYIFTRSGTTWSQQAKLIASDGASGDDFGNSVDIAVSLSGTVAVVGATLDDIAGNDAQGSAYIFTRSQFGTWSQTQKLVSPEGCEFCLFGREVSIDSLLGNTIVIGARDRIGANANQGSAYIFSRVNSVWTQQQKLTANDGATGDHFGESVSISGDTVIAGAEFDEVGNNVNQGSAYIFDLRDSIAPFDFDGDNKTDVGIFRPTVGEWWINRSSSAQTFALQFGQSTDRITPADFTGDGRSDIAFWRPSNGNWFILRSEDSSFYSFPFGANGDVPVPADYDGDGKADAAVFRPSNQVWYISKSSGGTEFIGFGAAGDKPVVADYDGDGRSDIAIFRPNGANGAEWWVRRSSDASVFALQFGISTDKPVQGDYSGDGRSDIAFFRPSNGNWFILRSEDFSFYSFPFGANGDMPVAGDYDGDGKFDPGVFRPTDKTWYIQRSTAGTSIQQFGQTGDKPVPNAFVP